MYTEREAKFCKGSRRTRGVTGRIFGISTRRMLSCGSFAMLWIDLRSRFLCVFFIIMRQFECYRYVLYEVELYDLEVRLGMCRWRRRRRTVLPRQSDCRF